MKSLAYDQNDDKRKKQRGAGGKPKNKLGKTGPRGRRFPKATNASFKPKPVVKGKYFPSGKVGDKIIDHQIDYAEKGKLFFSKDRDDISPEDVKQYLKENKGERVGFHHLMLSPGENAIDLKSYTRDQMRALEQEVGHPITWYSTWHDDTDHDHAHVYAAGRIPADSEIIKEAAER